MKKTILHAREYGYPPINLPEEILKKYDVTTTDYASQAIDFIRGDTGRSIDAFVLGVFMVKDNVPLEQINAAFGERDDAILRWEDAKGKPEEPRLKSRMDDLSNIAYRLVDSEGGIKVFSAIRERVGKTPILFLTSQDERWLAKEYGIVPDESKKVGIIEMPYRKELILDWVGRNVGQ